MANCKENCVAILLFERRLGLGLMEDSFDGSKGRCAPRQADDGGQRDDNARLRPLLIDAKGRVAGRRGDVSGDYRVAAPFRPPVVP